MREARNTELAAVAERTGRIDLVLIAPNDPEAMLRHTAECRARQYRLAADPSHAATAAYGQGRGAVPGDRRGIPLHQPVRERAAERAHRLESRRDPRPGRDVDHNARRRGCGSTDSTRRRHVSRRSSRARIVNPTGAGDGSRAGFLYGVGVGLSAERSAQPGCLVATTVLEAVGSSNTPSTAPSCRSEPRRHTARRRPTRSNLY